MSIQKIIKILSLIHIIIILSLFSYAYSTDPPTHQKITFEAYNLLNNNNLVYQEYKDEIGQYWDILLDGARYEDEEAFYKLSKNDWLGQLCAGHPFCNHFWNTLGIDAQKDTKGLNGYDSAYGRAQYLWNEAINDYKKGNKKEAYFKLGRISHLLQDVSVPAHTHKDIHIGSIDLSIIKINTDKINPEWDSDSYEVYMGEKGHWQDYSYRTKNIESFNYNIKSEKDPLFYLFSNLAEKADDYPSDDIKGEGGDNQQAININKKYEKLGFFEPK